MGQEVIIEKAKAEWAHEFEAEKQQLRCPRKKSSRYRTNRQYLCSRPCSKTGTRFDGRREQSQRSFSWIEPLQELGYEHVFHEAFPARRFFRKGKRRAGTRHLHVYIFQSEEWKNQLRFRNYLRKHSVERQAYETLKKTWRGVFHITGLLYKRKRIGSSQP